MVKYQLTPCYKWHPLIVSWIFEAFDTILLLVKENVEKEKPEISSEPPYAEVWQKKANEKSV